MLRLSWHVNIKYPCWDPSKPVATVKAPWDSRDSRLRPLKSFNRYCVLPCEDLLDKSRLSQLVEDLLTCRYRLFNLLVLFLSFMPEIYYLGQSWFSSEKLPKTVQVCFTYNILCLVWNEDLFSWKNPSKYFLSFVIFWR